jgi:hypothetical protein
VSSTTTEEDDKMAMELELGLLIQKLNPYADIMHLSLADPPANPATFQGALRGDAFEQVREAAEANIRQILVELETRQVEYLSWQFKDLPKLVKRAARIEYRHLYKSTGVWVTDHLLVGYEGSNGG